MSKSLQVGAAVIVVLVGLYTAWPYLPAAVQGQFNRNGSAANPNEGLNEGRREPRIPKVAKLPTPSERVALARDNPYWIELETYERIAAFRRLMAIDDPIAVVMANEIAMWCFRYADHMHAKIFAEIEAQGTTGEIKARQLALAMRERSRCVGFGQEDYNRIGERWGALLKEQGPRTVGTGEPKGPWQFPAILLSLREAATLEDPLAIENLGVFASQRLSGRFPMFDLGDGTMVTPRMMHAAFMLAACEYGRDCGPDGNFLVMQCVMTARCDAADLEQFYLRYWFPPGGEGHLLATRDMVLTGLATGRWPSNFRFLAPIRP
ncbi:hypothetical protein BWI17_00175 [Betaproteobacteria bacterium GR16-43]|nr:hypothetical protein BWI17_00175 [Betaproteobacteria bacterium GR16-43]